MSRDTFSYTHGDTGTEPASSLDFTKNERPQAGNFDWWWDSVIKAINGHASEFDALDSDNDGVVDKADTLVAGANLSGGLNAADGETIWNESGGYVPQSSLQNTSVTVAGNSVSLGNSTSVSHGDLSDAPDSAHHTRYADSEAVTAVNSETELTVDISGDADTLDGEDASAFADSGHSHSLGDLSNVTATGEGSGNGFDADTVDGEDASAFADSGHSHSQLHDKYTDSEAVSAVNNQTQLTVDISGDADTVDGENASAFADSGHSHALGDLSNVTATGEGSGNGFDADTVDGEDASAFADSGHTHSQLHDKYTDSEAVTAVNNQTSLSVDISGDADTLDGEHASAFADSGHLHDNRYYTESQSDARYARLFDGVQNPVYATMSDVPNMTKGEAVFVDGDGLYVEDGT